MEANTNTNKSTKEITNEMQVEFKALAAKYGLKVLTNNATYFEGVGKISFKLEVIDPRKMTTSTARTLSRVELHAGRGNVGNKCLVMIDNTAEICTITKRMRSNYAIVCDRTQKGYRVNFKGVMETPANSTLPTTQP